MATVLIFASCSIHQNGSVEKYHFKDKKDNNTKVKLDTKSTDFHKDATLFKKN